ncbi:tellurite resistance TerB family protein [Vibrio hannami]|uniref:tellurite resistance TerB family protein n=1 Tax=Vibrio hannami TaxID=2717094 RepID=UPI00240EAF52|nr:tellurite resistance TerB family protein [Vibrio hannami]MDG3087384.1 tellurite resistance TerB family protein [Vibrio hannami]
MDLKSLLNQALNSDIVKQGTEQLKQGSSNLGNMAKDNKSNLTAFGAGAVGGGLLGVLMGSKKAKKMGKKALGVTSAAALGALAYKLYNDYQGGNDSGSSPAQPQQQPETLDENQHSTLILKAMIAAAKADGHVDAEEQAKIEQALAEMGADDSVNTFVQTELNKPLDPSEVAQLVSSPQQATEVYLATLLVVDEQNFMEKAYLKELATQLNLADDLVLQLENQVSQ